MALAEAAGIMAAKKTPDILPLCHPLSLDQVSVTITLDAARSAASVTCTCSLSAKTGVEMEALTGCMAALLCLYDLIKPVDPALEITDVRLQYKEGGKKGFWKHPKEKNGTPPSAATTTKRKVTRIGTAAVVTVSDRVHAKKYKDTSGPALAFGLERIGLTIKERHVVPDDQHAIVSILRRASRGVDLIVLTGGTGLSPRDVTPEAVLAVCDRVIPGIGESLRALGPITSPSPAPSRGFPGNALSSACREAPEACATG
ncbi:MAG: molybdopterin-binding protein [Elusimicrobiota bacterium]|nr:MAG: molybdopterin-binding protein [Elusimicrobiota bacterium]